MPSLVLSTAFNTDHFWAARVGPPLAVANSTTTYRFLNAAGYYVQVTGTGFTVDGAGNFSAGTYTAIAVYSDATFTSGALVATGTGFSRFAQFYFQPPDSQLALVDFVTGSSGNDTITAYAGADEISAGLGNDIIRIVQNDFTTTGNIVNGGDGIDRISMAGPNSSNDWDLRNGTFSNIEAIEFFSGSVVGANYIDFNSSQIGGNAISATANIIGSNNDDDLRIFVTGNVNLTAWSFTNWDTAHDLVRLDASAAGGNQLITGSTTRDVLVAGPGMDTLQAGDGNDVIQVLSAAAITGSNTGATEVIDGGLGNDYVYALTLDIVDFRNVNFISVEGLAFGSGYGINAMYLSASEIGGDSLSDNLFVTGNSQPNNIIIEPNVSALVGAIPFTISLQSWLFSNWSANDSIQIQGANYNDLFLIPGNTITGSSNSDQIIGGNGADTLRGYGGDDYLIGNAGADVFIFNGITDDLTPASREVVADYLYGTDTLRIQGTSMASTVQATGPNALVTFANGAQIQLNSNFQNLIDLVFDQRTEHWDTGLNATWNHYIDNFDTLGRRTHQTGLMDSGLTYYEDYDELDAESWARITYWNDALARPDAETGQLDNGRVYDSDHDNGNLYAWSRIDYWRDALGRSDVETGFLDDGRTYNSDLDNGDAFAWLRIDNWADSLGRLDYQNGVYDADDVTRPGWTWQVDYDQANEFTWSRVERFFNAAGVLQSETFIN